jgi:hypothetical protein
MFISNKDDEKLPVSISHSGYFSIGVVGKQIERIGIDAELNSRNDRLRTISTLLPVDRSSNRDLMERWVVKESIIKASNDEASFYPENYFWSDNWVILNGCGGLMEFRILLWRDFGRTFAIAFQ